MKKSEIVREAVKSGDYKKALRIAKDFQIGISKEQRDKMTRAYECMVHPDFYRQLGNTEIAIESGIQVVKSLYGERRTVMKWDDKNNRAKDIMDAAMQTFAEGWTKVERFTEGLSPEDIKEVQGRLDEIVDSVRSRYKIEKKELPVAKAEEQEPKEQKEETAEPVKKTRKRTKKGEKADV